MSFAKINEINTHFNKVYGTGIEEIRVCDRIFKALLIDIASLRVYDHEYRSSNFIEQEMQIIFHTNDNQITIVNTGSDIIQQKREQIAKLQRDINFLEELSK